MFLAFNFSYDIFNLNLDLCMFVLVQSIWVQKAFFTIEFYSCHRQMIEVSFPFTHVKYK